MNDKESLDKLITICYEFVDRFLALGLRQSAEHRLLYAEDNTITQKLFSRMMEKHFDKIDVFGVQNGRLALEEVKLKRFDLILLDVEMPHITGLECTVEIRKYQKEKGEKASKICIVSSNELYEDAAYAAGADFFYLKEGGYQVKELLTIIQTLLGIKL